MPCAYEDSLQNDLLSFNATYALRGQYGGNVALSNRGEQYSSSDMRNKAFSISLVIGGDEFGCDNETIAWINGIVSEFSESNEEVEKQASLNIASYFSRLSSKPINTFEYLNETPDDIVTDVLDTFGGVPSGLISVDISNPVVIDRVSLIGNNFIDEVKKFCAAFGTDIYVNKNGLLLVRDWKDETSDVDFAIPSYAIVSANKEINNSLGPSRYKIRGRFVSNIEPSDTISAPSGGGNNQTHGGRPQGRKQVSGGAICVLSGIPQVNANIQIKAGVGDKGMAGAEPELGGYTNSLTLTNDNASLKMDIGYSASGGSFPAGSVYQIPMSIYSYVIPERETNHDIMGNKRDQEGRHQLHHKFKIIANELKKGGADKGPGGSGGRPPSQPSNKRGADEASEINIECTTSDSDLISEYGVRVETVENPYLLTVDQCCSLGQRLFKEFKMSRNSWRVQLGAVIPCIDVGYVVTFQVPNSDRVITGQIAEIQISYENTPQATMQLLVQSFEEL